MPVNFKIKTGMEEPVTTIDPSTVVKVKAKAKTSDTTLAQQKAMQLIQLHHELESTQAFALLKEYEKVKKELQSIAIESGAPADKQFVFEAKNGTVVFSPCRKETKVTDKAGLISALGTEVFFAIADVSITNAKTYLSDIELGKVTTVTNGSRSLASVNYKAE